MLIYICIKTTTIIFVVLPLRPSNLTIARKGLTSLQITWNLDLSVSEYLVQVDDVEEKEGSSFLDATKEIR